MGVVSLVYTAETAGLLLMPYYGYSKGPLMTNTRNVEPLRIFLAEYASMQKDGSVSVIRGFLTDLVAEQFPTVFNCFVVLDIPVAGLEQTSKFTITVATPDQLEGEGSPVMAGEFALKKDKVAAPRAQATLGLSFLTNVYGEHRVRARIGTLSGDAYLTVRRPEA